MNRLHLYRGDGKGKTTAAMGLALRALGHGRSVLVAQFMKDGESGELKALGRFEKARVMAAPPMAGFTWQMDEAQLAQSRAEQSAFARQAAEAAAGLRPEMTVLDELGAALETGLVTEEDARALIAAALESGETIVTGYRAPEWLAEMADYVSDIRCVMHPFAAEGLPAREGIEW